MVKDTMSEKIIKDSGARTQSPGSSGTQCAEKVSTSEKKNAAGSPFIHSGKAEFSHAALHISYEAFHEWHDVFIEMTDLSRIIKSRFEPAAPVKECRKEPDGTETTQKIGYACRTASGKALKINTIHSDGDLLLPWLNLQEIVSRKRDSAPVSRLRVPEAPRPAPKPVATLAPASSRSIREGLTTGF